MPQNQTELDQRIGSVEFEFDLESDLSVLSRLSEKIRVDIQSEIQRRHALILEVLSEYEFDPQKVFQALFGGNLHNPGAVKLIVRRYGLYFSGFDQGMYNVIDVSPSLIGGRAVAFNRGSLGELKDSRFSYMVAFGEPVSKDHELQHLFNSMFPYNHLYSLYTVVLDLFPLLTANSIKLWYERLLWYRFNVIVRDEFVVRIVTDQIYNLVIEPDYNVLTGGHYLFTSYGREWQSIPALGLSSEEFHQLPQERQGQFTHLIDQDITVMKEVENRYRKVFNQILEAVKQELENGVDKGLLLANILSCEDFSRFEV